jgi:DNA-directed RNA polymerases I, II, and III subunit RPABC2
MDEFGAQFGVEDSLFDDGAPVDFLAEEEAEMGAGEEAKEAEGEKPVRAAQRITTRFMTKYEKARILGTRALQLR